MSFYYLPYFLHSETPSIGSQRINLITSHGGKQYIKHTFPFEDIAISAILKGEKKYVLKNQWNRVLLSHCGTILSHLLVSFPFFPFYLALPQETHKLHGNKKNRQLFSTIAVPRTGGWIREFNVILTHGAMKGNLMHAAIEHWVQSTTRDLSFWLLHLGVFPILGKDFAYGFAKDL